MLYYKSLLIYRLLFRWMRNYLMLLPQSIHISPGSTNRYISKCYRDNNFAEFNFKENKTKQT